MLKRWIFLFAILPAAALAAPPENPSASAVTSKAPPPAAANAVPPPPSAVTPGTPRSTGRQHGCGQNYPEAAVKAGIEGTTTLSFVVTAQGAVTRVTVAKSSGNADLDDAAIACASTWTYKPATQNDVPVETPWQATVQWSLHDDAAAYRLTPLCTRYHPLTEQMLPKIGSVTMLILRLMPDGNVTQAKILGSSGDAGLDDAALRCVNAQHIDLAGLAAPPPDGLLLPVSIDWPAQFHSSEPVAPPFPAGFIRPSAVGWHGPCAKGLQYVPRPENIGPTIVSLTITNEGEVENAAVQHTSGSDGLDRGALSCVAKWHYRPATINGSPRAIQWVAKVDWHER